MNKDAEAINQFLAWLLQEPDSAIAPSGTGSPGTVPAGEDFSGQAKLDPGVLDLQPVMDPLDSEVEAIQAELSEATPPLFQDLSSLDFGEIPAVQDRFHAIIKRRLRTEIERNPPLFPWESRLWDYESEQPDLVPDSTIWSAQLQALKLPVAMPEALLLQIFAECRAVAQASMRQGVKLVRAIERFFPQDQPTLNYWAGQVLAEPARGAASMSTAEFPQTYEQAGPTQQMVLSLLAAQRLLEAMTLQLSADRPQIQRQWMTTAGVLLLTGDYSPQTHQLIIQAQLPTTGQLTLQGPSSQITAVGSETEPLTLTADQAMPHQTYTLEVELEAGDRTPLSFSIHLLEEDL